MQCAHKRWPQISSLCLGHFLKNGEHIAHYQGRKNDLEGPECSMKCETSYTDCLLNWFMNFHYVTRNTTLGKLKKLKAVWTSDCWNPQGLAIGTQLCRTIYRNVTNVRNAFPVTAEHIFFILVEPWLHHHRWNPSSAVFCPVVLDTAARADRKLWFVVFWQKNIVLKIGYSWGIFVHIWAHMTEPTKNVIFFGNFENFFFLAIDLWTRFCCLLFVRAAIRVFQWKNWDLDLNLLGK